MKNFLLKNLSRLLIVVLLSGLTAATSFAAIDDYTVSGGNPGGPLPNVGDASISLPDITLTDVGGDDFTNNPETLRVLINPTNYSAVVLDDTVVAGSLSLGAGTCGYTTIDSVTYAGDSTYADVVVSGGTCAAPGQTIILQGLKVETIYAQAAPGANPLILVDNVTTSSGTPQVTTDVIDLAVLVGDLTSTNVEPGSLALGSETANTVTFTTTAEIPADGLIVVTYPAGFDVSGAVNGTNLTGIDGTLTVGVSGQDLTFTRGGGATAYTGAVSFTIDTGIITPFATGATGTYTITTQTSTSADIEQDTAVSADTIAGGGGGDDEGPFMPADFAVEVDEDLHVVLTWTDPTNQDLEKIQVIRSKGEGVEPSSIVAQVITAQSNGTVETYTDEDVVEGDIVNYYLRPVDDNGNWGAVTETLSITVEAGAVVDETTAEEVVEDESVAEEVAEEVVEEPVDEEMPEEAPAFSDIAEHWAEAEVNGMAAEGIAYGNPDGTFTPNGFLNRAEAAALLYRLLGYDEPEAPELAPFPDVPTDIWFAGYVSNMKALDMIHGYGDGTYGPGNNITRAEFTKLALEAYYFIVDDEEIRDVIDGWMDGAITTAYSDLEEDWYTPYVTTAANMGFTHGFKCGESRCFGATDDITRAEATVMLYNIFYEYLIAEIIEEILEEEEVV